MVIIIRFLIGVFRGSSIIHSLGNYNIFSFGKVFNKTFCLERYYI